MPAKYSADAIQAAIACQEKTNVPATVTLAQYDLESSCGKHMPAGSNNPFGIKAVAGQPYVSAMTWEVVGGTSERVSQNFAKYASLDAAFEAHGALLNKPLYADAIKAWKAGDLPGGITAMSKHYATDPNYGSKIENVIQSDNLAVLVGQALAKAKVPVAKPNTLAKVSPAPAKATAVASTPGGSPMNIGSVLSSVFGNFGSSLSALVTVGEYAPTVISDIGATVPDIQKAVVAIEALVADIGGGKYGNLGNDVSAVIADFEAILRDAHILPTAVPAATKALATTPSVDALRAQASKA